MYLLFLIFMCDFVPFVSYDVNFIFVIVCYSSTHLFLKCWLWYINKAKTNQTKLYTHSASNIQMSQLILQIWSVKSKTAKRIANIQTLSWWLKSDMKKDRSASLNILLLKSILKCAVLKFFITIFTCDAMLFCLVWLWIWLFLV